MGALTHFIRQILDFFYHITGSYGSAIIVTTIIVRLILLPLSIKQEQVQRKQLKLQPKLKILEKKYKGNKRSPEYMQAQRELMKEEGANPILGCLPLVIQIPIFFALYRALSPHYSQPPISGHFLWFDLADTDKAFMIGAFAINLLPIISALLQVAQSYLTQKTMNHPHLKDITEGEENTAEKVTKSMNSMMYVMPIVMLFVFYKFPSGLNVYYIITTIFSIVQSYIFLKTRKGFYSNLEAEVEQLREEMKSASNQKGNKGSKKSKNNENKKEVKETTKKSLRKTKSKEEIQELRKQKNGKKQKKMMDPLDKKED